MNKTNIVFYHVKDVKVEERDFDNFTCYDIIVDGTEITLYTEDHKDIPFFVKINRIISSLEAHPDDIQGEIEELKELFPNIPVIKRR